jgi:hypothetical protein
MSQAKFGNKMRITKCHTSLNTHIFQVIKWQMAVYQGTDELVFSNILFCIQFLPTIIFVLLFTKL